MSRLGPLVLDRLVKLCGMFSSLHDGERATAAAKADLVRAHGITWRELLVPRETPRSRALAAEAHRGAECVGDEFSTHTPGVSFAEKQQAKLDDIERKVHSFIQSREFRNARSS